MRTTLRAYLTGPNVSLDVHDDANCSKARTDLASSRWPVIDEWQWWEDFNIENINALLGPLLDTSFEVADPPPPLNSSRLLRHESQFDFVLVRRNNIIVNEALRVACSHLGLNQIEWTRGGNDTGERTFPDWSGTLVGDERNLIPGDSKFTREFLRPERKQKDLSHDAEDPSHDSEDLAVSSPLNRATSLARSCLQQVNNEAAIRKIRYFYIITNQELFLCRRTQDPPLDSPIAARRTKRPEVGRLESTPTRVRVSRLDSTPTQPHAVYTSSPPPFMLQRQHPAIGLDQVLADLSPSHPTSPATPFQPDFNSDSTYQGANVEDDTGCPECVSISWKEENGLTVNLGLFAIHLLALISNGVRTEYEPIHIDPEYRAKLKV